MATPIRFKRSAVENKRPALSDLQLGEIALNTYDGRLFAERDTGGIGIGTTVALLTPWTETFGAAAIYYQNNVAIGATNPDGRALYVDGNVEVTGVTTFTGIVTNFSGFFATEFSVSGLSTFNSNVDINADLDVSGELEVTGLSTFSSLVDFNAGVQANTLKVEDLTDNRVVISGSGGELEDDANLTFDGSKLSVGTGLDVAGVTTLSSSGGITTTGGDLYVGGDLFVADDLVFDEFTARNGNITGIATAGTLGVLGIATAKELTVTGVITASSITGTISTATSLENARDFSVTGDFVTAPAVSFDGTGNVSLAATITPDSITLGTYTQGDYVESITGTSNEVEVTGGTGEGSTPQIGLPNDVTIAQDLTVSRDVQIVRNLNVDGNITVGGTTATIITQTLTVSDADLILGFRTDGNGTDVSNDTTANHGGIAIASTEGSPLTTLVNPGAGETLPSTYKKIMWFKSGSFAGLGTDAWLSNYAVGVGSTQLPYGTRFAAGNVQITEDDISVVRDINASGIITALGGITGTATTATNLTGGDTGDIPYQDSAGITTFVDATSASTGQILLWDGAKPVWDNVSAGAESFGGITVDDDDSTIGTAGSITKLNFGTNLDATATTGANGIATVNVSSTPTFDELTVTGVATASDFSAGGQSITNLIGQKIGGFSIQEEGTNVGAGIGTFETINFVGDNITATAGVGSTAIITLSDSPTFDEVTVTGIVTATGGFNLGIQSASTDVASGVITALNFIGAGNTFAYDASNNTIDISIAGGGGEIGIDTNTDNADYSVTYATSFGSTTGLGATDTLTFNPSTGTLSAPIFSGDGSGLSGVSGFATALSNDSTSPLFRIFREDRSLNVTGINTIDVDSASGKLAFTKADSITVAVGATLEVGSGTTFRTNVIDLFPADQDLNVVANNLRVSGITTFTQDVNIGTDQADGVVLTSPNGSKFRLTVDNSGNVSTTAL